MNTKKIWTSILAIVATMATVGAVAADAPKMKMTTEIPESITTPDSVETRIGTLRFFDGYPDDATTQRVYDNLDFMNGVKEGDVLTIEYLRDGKVGTVEVEPRPVEMSAWAFSAPRDFRMPEIHVAPELADKYVESYRLAWPGNVWADMELVELSEGLGKYFGADAGVLVVSAPEDDALQLEDGDVILSIDGREPTSVRHALRILGSYQAGETVEIEIMRDKRKRTLEVDVPDGRQSKLYEWAPTPRPAAAPRVPSAPGKVKT